MNRRTKQGGEGGAVTGKQAWSEIKAKLHVLGFCVGLYGRPSNSNHLSTLRHGVDDVSTNLIGPCDLDG